MSALVLWIAGIIWFIMVPTLIVVENRGDSELAWCFAVWALITLAFFSGVL